MRPVLLRRHCRIWYNVRTGERRWSSTCTINLGPRRCTAARPSLRLDHLAESKPLHRRRRCRHGSTGAKASTGPKQSMERGVLRRPPFAVPESACRAVGTLTGRFRAMTRPVRFEHYRYVGDKRSLVVYDLDLYGVDDEVTAAVDRLLESERFLAISPQTLAEARNRGYRPHRSIVPTEAE